MAVSIDAATARMAYNYLQGHLGSILPNGDDYEEETVFRITNKMLPFRLRAAAVALPIAAVAV